MSRASPASQASSPARPAAWLAAAGATADPVKDYLKQIGKVPLLNAGQEVELAKRIEAGLFAEEKLAEGSRNLPPARGSVTGVELGKQVAGGAGSASDVAGSEVTPQRLELTERGQVSSPPGTADVHRQGVMTDKCQWHAA